MRTALLATVWLLSTVVPAYAGIVTTVVYNDSEVTSLAAADGLSSGGVRSASGIVSFIDFFDSDNDTGEGRGRFENNLPFLGELVGVDDNYFAMRNTGFLHIETAGDYTFGTNSDDGARLRIDFGSGLQNVIVHDNVLPPGEYFGTVNFASAGTYAFDFVYFENNGQATTELFAAFGMHAASSNAFRLVGDTANGGLATSVPEPSSMALIGLFGTVATLGRFRKRR
jgi:hypothetical protein